LFKKIAYIRGKGNPMKVYHGSYHLFDTVDPIKVMGAGSQSAYGQGFYVATSRQYVEEHLSKRPDKGGAVIYELDLDIPEENILSGSKLITESILRQAQNTAREEGHQSLADHHRIYIDEAKTDPYFNGNEYYQRLSNFLGGKVEAANFLVQAGFDALANELTNPPCTICTVMNLGCIGALKPVAYIGQGPMQPDGTRATLKQVFGESARTEGEPLTPARLKDGVSNSIQRALSYIAGKRL
jgi:hypothetical protein